MLSKNAVGIDITDEQVVFAALDVFKKVSVLHSVLLPEGVVSGGKIRDAEKFEQVLKNELLQQPAITKLGSHTAYVCIPEAHTWSHTVFVPNEISKENVFEYARTEAAKYIPIPLTELYTGVCITVLRNTRFVTVVAARKELVDSYVSPLTRIGLHVVFVGSRFFSIARSCLPKTFEKQHYMLINCDPRGCTLGVFDGHAVAYISVRVLKNSSEPNMNLVNEVAMLESLSVDIRSTLDLFKEKTGQEVTHIVYVGDKTQSRDNSLLQHLKQEYSQTVEFSTPDHHVTYDINNASDIPVAKRTAAIGLALYGIDHSFAHASMLDHTNFVESVDSWYQQAILKHMHVVYAFLNNNTKHFRRPIVIKTSKTSVIVLLLLSAVLIFYVLTL